MVLNYSCMCCISSFFLNRNNHTPAGSRTAYKIRPLPYSCVSVDQRYLSMSTILGVDIQEEEYPKFPRNNNTTSQERRRNKNLPWDLFSSSSSFFNNVLMLVYSIPVGPVQIYDLPCRCCCYAHLGSSWLVAVRAEEKGRN